MLGGAGGAASGLFERTVPFFLKRILAIQAKGPFALAFLQGLAVGVGGGHWESGFQPGERRLSSGPSLAFPLLTF